MLRKGQETRLFLKRRGDECVTVYTRSSKANEDGFLPPGSQQSRMWPVYIGDKESSFSLDSVRWFFKSSYWKTMSQLHQLHPQREVRPVDIDFTPVEMLLALY